MCGKLVDLHRADATVRAVHNPIRAIQLDVLVKVHQMKAFDSALKRTRDHAMWTGAWRTLQSAIHVRLDILSAQDVRVAQQRARDQAHRALLGHVLLQLVMHQARSPATQAAHNWPYGAMPLVVCASVPCQQIVDATVEFARHHAVWAEVSHVLLKIARQQLVTCTASWALQRPKRAHLQMRFDLCAREWLNGDVATRESARNRAVGTYSDVIRTRRELTFEDGSTASPGAGHAPHRAAQREVDLQRYERHHLAAAKWARYWAPRALIRLVLFQL